MRQLIVSEFVTLDGVMEAPGGEEGHGLIDEYRLMIFPLVLGSGMRLFPESPDKTVLALADTQTFESGVVVQTYHPGAS
jgi:dihydrofolate reductase